MFRSPSLFACICFAALLGFPCLANADRYALLIGVERYEDSDIVPLGAACADARELGKTLVEVAGFPADHVVVLTSDGKVLPKKNNIVFYLGQLANKVKPGDTVLFFYSGHGRQIDGKAYLAPYDADLRNSATSKSSLLSSAEVKEELESLPADAVIAMYDMCRTEPQTDGNKGNTPSQNNLGTAQAKDLALTVKANTGPKSVLTFYSCSPGQRSWEWPDQHRGFFSYYLEKGLREAAADESGTVHVQNLIDYVCKAVPGAVQLNKGKDEDPYPESQGKVVMDLVLATDRPHGNGGSTAVPTVVGNDIESRYQAIYQKATEYWGAKNWSAAATMYEAANLTKETVEATYMAGRSRYELKEYDAAEQLYRKAIDLNPKYEDAEVSIGVLCQDITKRNDEAEKHYRRAMELDTTDWVPYNNLGMIYRDVKQDLPNAEVLLRKAMTLSPSSDEPVRGLGLVFEYRKEYPEAERLFIRALELNPKSEPVETELGWLYYGCMNEQDKGEQHYRRAIELDPTSVVPVYNLGALFENKKNYIEAERLFLKASELDPKDADAEYELGWINQEVNLKLDEAVKHYREAIARNSRLDTAYNNLGAIYLADKHDATEAEKLFRKAVEFGPKDGLHHANLANALFDLNQKDEAMTEAKKAKELGLENHEVYAKLGIKD